VEQFAARAQLEDDEVVLLRFAELNELHNVGMVKVAHDLNFFENVGSLEVLR